MPKWLMSAMLMLLAAGTAFAADPAVANLGGDSFTYTQDPGGVGTKSPSDHNGACFITTAAYGRLVPHILAAHGASGTPDGTRREKDTSGKEWVLTDWKNGTRPYPKDLKEREK